MLNQFMTTNDYMNQIATLPISLSDSLIFLCIIGIIYIIIGR